MNDPITGFSIPFRIEGGRVARAEGAEKLKENLVHLLLTGIGERLMLREYGGGLRQLVHDPNNDALRAIVQHQVARSIARWEPRVAVQSVEVSQQGATLVVTLRYSLPATGQADQVQVPLQVG